MAPAGAPLSRADEVVCRLDRRAGHAGRDKQPSPQAVLRSATRPAQSAVSVRQMSNRKRHRRFKDALAAIGDVKENREAAIGIFVFAKGCLKTRQRVSGEGPRRDAAHGLCKFANSDETRRFLT